MEDKKLVTYPTEKLGEVLENVPKVRGILAKKYSENGKYPIIDQGQSIIGGYTDDLAYVYKGELPVIVFGDHTRAIKYIDFTFAVGADGTQILRPKKEIVPKYFYYFLYSIDLPSRGYARHFKLLKEFQVPLPPLSEQKKIVATIELQFAKIDEAARLRVESKKLADQLLPAALHEVFEEGKKKKWKLFQIGDKEIMEISSGGTPSRSNKDSYEGQIIWLKSGELNDNTEIVDSEEHITDEALDGSSAKIFPAGSVLFAMYGATAGKLGILSKPATTNQAVAGITPKLERLDSKYLFYCLLNVREDIINQAWGGAQPNLSQTIIKTFKIPVPPLTEQNKIVKKLDAISEKVSALKELQLKQAADFKALKQGILRKVFGT